MNIHFDPETLRGQLFAGLEVEGLMRGRKTLFVAGDVNADKIVQTFRELAKTSFSATHIYFGASGMLTYNPEEVRATMEQLSEVPVTIESTEVYTELMQTYPKLHWMIPLLWHSVHVNPKTFAFVGASSKAPRVSRSYMPQSIDQLHQFVVQERKSIVDRINVKWDYGSHCLVAPLSSLTLTTSVDYQNDNLIENLVR